MKLSIVSLGLAFAVALAGTPFALAGATNAAVPPNGGSGTVRHPFEPVARPFTVAPHSVAQPPSVQQRSQVPQTHVAAYWKQNWQLSWINYCQRWIMGPQGEWLNPDCYVPLFGLLGYAPGSPFYQALFGDPGFTGNSRL